MSFLHERAAMRNLLFAMLSLVVISGCESEKSISAALMPLSDCSDVESRVRDNALRDMNQRLYDNYLVALQAEEWCWGWDDDVLSGADGDPRDDGGGNVPPPSGEDEGGASEYSETNNQVDGVDEADFIKNDANYLYVVSDGALRIINAWPAPQTHVTATVPIEGTPKKLFVLEDRALVYSSLEEASDEYSWQPKECTYGYHCSFTGDGNPTKITVLDMTDRYAPEVVRELWLSGSYVNARRIGTAVHTVVSDTAPVYEGLSYWPDSFDYCSGASIQEITTEFARLRAANTRIIMATALTDYLPTIREAVGGGEAQVNDDYLGSCDSFYASTLEDGAAITSILSLDIFADDSTGFTSIVSYPGALYGAADALYISVPHQQGSGGWYGGMEGVDEASTVHKFALASDPPSSNYRGSGVVKGRVLNQFSMDQWEEHLRIATTTGHVPNPDVHSTLSVLSEQDGELVTVGVLDDIAPTEDIRSVRFAGERGFIVTFKKTDPLFYLSLADPEDPKIMSELKIPGFSTYMQLMDTTHLMTIGYDADDQGSFAWFTGVMLQIFDVCNPLDPELVHKEVIGTRGSSSEALTNHLAFNYFAPKELLSIPMTLCEDSSGGGSYGTNMTFSGLMVFDVTAADGFSLHGQVDHPVGTGIDCSNWWTDATSQVKRSVIMDDYVFSVSETLIKVNNLADLATDVVVVPIAD